MATKGCNSNFLCLWVTHSVPSRHDRVADLIATTCFEIHILKTKEFVLCFVLVLAIAKGHGYIFL